MKLSARGRYGMRTMLEQAGQELGLGAGALAGSGQPPGDIG
jgi:hypothetical protein